MNWPKLLLLATTVAAAQPLVIAHRGGAAHWPENSIEAFRQAIAAGIRLLETDAVLTRDNRVVLNHDLATARGPIRFNDFKDLGRPALEDLLALVAGKDITIMLETKMAAPDAPDAVSPESIVTHIDTLLRRYNASSQIILQSFDHRTLAAMKTRNPAVRLCMLNPKTRLPDYVAPARALGAQIQFINFRIIEPADVSRLHHAGLKVFSGTTSDPAEWRKLIAMGVDGILTDDPLGLARMTR